MEPDFQICTWLYNIFCELNSTLCWDTFGLNCWTQLGSYGEGVWPFQSKSKFINLQERLPQGEGMKQPLKKTHTLSQIEWFSPPYFNPCLETTVKYLRKCRMQVTCDQCSIFPWVGSWSPINLFLKQDSWNQWTLAHKKLNNRKLKN